MLGDRMNNLTDRWARLFGSSILSSACALRFFFFLSFFFLFLLPSHLSPPPPPLQRSSSSSVIFFYRSSRHAPVPALKPAALAYDEILWVVYIATQWAFGCPLGMGFGYEMEYKQVLKSEGHLVIQTFRHFDWLFWLCCHGVVLWCNAQ